MDNENNVNNSAINMNILRKQRLEKLQTIINMGINPYPTKFERTDNIGEVKLKFSETASEEPNQKEISIAGRITTMRKMGKASFFNVKDWYDKIQIYIKKDICGEENFKIFSEFDISDIVGIKGNVFKTKTGELSILAKEVNLLAKSLKALPIVKEKETVEGEKIKFDEVSDLEFKYRQRYVDLNISEESKNIFKKRSQIISFIRNYLIDKNFLEVETPITQTLYGGAAAKPFETYHNALNMPLYLRIAPELYLKRLIAGGVDRVFEIGKNFRNEGISTKHNPEFTMLELYQSYADYNDIMDLVENMITECLKKVNNGDMFVKFGDITLDFNKRWNRIKLEDLFKKYADIDFQYLENLDEINKVADKFKILYDPNSTVQKIYDLIFENKIEKHLIEPTIVYDFPKAWSPLAK
ncbi:MAG: lysine--tRNA ligase, partial [Elusimicrobiota bacterium]|nr:lysine--tRNA ligase [Elusimicrobiota bacterium]